MASIRRHLNTSVGGKTPQASTSAPDGPPRQEAIRTNLVRLACDTRLPHAQRLVSLHDLNRHLAAAPTFDSCVSMVSTELPPDVLKVALDLVASGSSQSFVALNLLGFCALSDVHLDELLRLDTVPFLLGIARASADDYELLRASIALLVTLGESGRKLRAQAQHGDGAGAVGQARGAAVVAGTALTHSEAEMRALGARMTRVLLASPAGRKQAVGSAKLARAMAEVVGAGGEMGPAIPDGLDGDDLPRQVGAMMREMDIYRRRFKALDAQK